MVFMAIGTFALTTPTLPTGNVLTTLSYSAISDPDGLLSGGNLFTIPVGDGGTYSINQQTNIQINQPGFLFRCSIVSTAGNQTVYLGNSLYCGVSPAIQLAAGDTIQIQLSNNSTAVAQLDTANSKLQIVKLA